MEIPVYLFTGFLESGKTKFIQETLEDSRFNSGEKTLLLLCEEGEEEYDPLRFYASNVYIHIIEDISELLTKTLEMYRKQHNCERVVIEYNGMWMLDSLYNTLPEGWIVYQEIMFADATTFLSYNSNMRSLVVDKLKSCEMVIFNRSVKGKDYIDFHKIVRAISRGADIAYEYEDGTVEYDSIEDPLPFDINSPIINIEDVDYALWYRDLTEDVKKYVGKTVCFKGIVAKNSKLASNEFAAGRHVMTCCVEDITYAGLICISPTKVTLKTKDWVIVKGRIEEQKHPIYDGAGPVLIVESITQSEQPTQEIATFY